MKKRRFAIQFFTGLIIPVLVLIIWYTAGVLDKLNQVLIPTLQTILSTVGVLISNGSLFTDISVSFGRVLKGFAIGASGCGKSTLIRILAGLEKETTGEVLVDDKPVVKPNVKTGMIFQEARLFPWLSVEKNIEFGIHDNLTKEKKEKVAEMIQLIELEGFEKAISKQLSGGMQQRVNIARALINKPDILLLDEPFGALDALTRINMQNEVLKIWEKEKTTMVLITHDIDEAIFLSDRIVILSNKPGIISKVINVEMSKPRDRSSYEFMKIRRRKIIKKSVDKLLFTMYDMKQEQAIVIL